MKKISLMLTVIFACNVLLAQVQYTSPEKYFTVTFPTQPEYRQSENTSDSLTNIIHNYFSMENPNVVYMVSVADLFYKELSKKEMFEVLEHSANGFFETLETSPEKRKEIKQKNIQGLEYSGNKDNYYITYRVYIHNHKMFQVAVLGIGQAPNKKNMEKFFKSFKILQ